MSEGFGGMSKKGKAETFSDSTAFASGLFKGVSGPDLAVYTTAGFITGGYQKYGTNDLDQFGWSAAVLTGSPAQAQDLASYFKKGQKAGTPADTVVSRLTAVPGSQAVVAKAESTGKSGQKKTYVLAGTVFTDGPYVYVELGAGPDALVDEQAILHASQELYARVMGKPAPD